MTATGTGSSDAESGHSTRESKPRQRRQRTDAQRNVSALLAAAKTVFVASGVDAPAKEITDLAGVGVGTLYRHFPRRSDLVVAVLQREVDVCADAGPTLSEAHEPAEALTQWLLRLTEFVGTKRGLASALHSGDPAFDGLPDYLMQKLEPALESLLAAATATGEIRDDVSAKELIHTVALLCQTIPGQALAYNQRMVAVFTDGLRRSAGTAQS
jgi:AcrR family transcriptional regulator